MRRPSRYRLLLLAVWLLGSTTLIGVNAGAHGASTYYPIKWLSSSPDIGWYFTPNFATSQNKRDRMRESFATWTNVSNSAISFTFKGNHSTGYTASNPCSSSYNGVFYNTTVEYGGTYHCVRQGSTPDSYYISRFSLVMQEAGDSFWDDGAGDTGNNNFKAVATHEAGHAGGFGTKYLITGDPADMHFPVANTSDGICWNDDTFHTMCSGLTPAPAKMSTLEAHDIHTVQDAY